MIEYIQDNLTITLETEYTNEGIQIIVELSLDSVHVSSDSIIIERNN